MRLSAKHISVILATVAGLVVTVCPAKSQDPAPFANCRLGAGGVAGDVLGYDLGQLNLGLYTDWITRDPLPAGLPADVEYIQTVRLHQDKVCGERHCVAPYVDPPTYTVWPNLNTLAARSANQPGMLWLIGNEIDRRDWGSGESSGGQDEMTAELYARAFHEIQNVIKTADPTAKIGIAGIVQATPLRLEYLDLVWDSYYAQYGYPMGNDIDIWNVHGFILREVRGEWGADTPPGFDGPGFLYGADFDTCIDAHHDMSYFREFIEAFRIWMAEHGERNKPLLITEYGILYGTLGISTAQIIDFMSSTFDYLSDIKDEATGYPADEDRLVQGWIWYSLNDNSSWYHDGALFDSTTKNLTTLGNAWKSYVSDPGNPLASQPQLNLLVTNLRADPNLYFVLPGETVTITLRVDVANSGNTTTNTGNHIVVTLWDGVPDAPGSNLIASQTLDDLPGCGRVVTVEANWPGLRPGEHTWYVRVEPIANETNATDNTASGVVSILLLGDRVFLPIVLK
jgi:hypothetical protein